MNPADSDQQLHARVDRAINGAPPTEYPEWLSITPRVVPNVAVVCGSMSRARRNAVTTWGEFARLSNANMSHTAMQLLEQARATGTPNSTERHAALNAALLDGRQKDAREALRFLAGERHESRVAQPDYVCAGAATLKRIDSETLRVSLRQMWPWNLPTAVFEGPTVADLHAQVEAELVRQGLLPAPAPA